eukprot:scaffold53670_cov35-Attheya_sp.AAC.1
MARRESRHNLFHVAPSVQYVPSVYFYDVAYADPALVEDGLTFAPAEVRMPWWSFFYFLPIGVCAIHSSKKADGSIFYLPKRALARCPD